MEQEWSQNKNTNKNINKNMEMGAETGFLTPTHRYDDIINLPHPISHIHPPMPIEARAAQFMPCSPDRACGGNQGGRREGIWKSGKSKKRRSPGYNEIRKTTMLTYFYSEVILVSVS